MKRRINHLPRSACAAGALLAAVLMAGCTGSGVGSAPPGDEDQPAQATFSKSFGGPRNDVARAAIRTSDGGFIFVGTFDEGEDVEDGQLWVHKLDANGNSEWQRVLGEPGSDGPNERQIVLVRPLGDGGFIAAGYLGAIRNPMDDPALPEGHTGRDAWVGKYSADGVLAWSRTYDSGAWTNYPFAEPRFGRGNYADDEAVDVWPCADGTYLVAVRSHATLTVGDPVIGMADFEWPTGSTTHIFEDARSMVVMKLAPDGALIWKRRATQGQFVREVEAALGGYETGEYHGTRMLLRPTFDGGALAFLREDATHGHVLRYDSGGSVLWRFDTGTLDALDMLQVHEPRVDDPAPGVRDDGFVLVTADDGLSRVIKLSHGGQEQWQRDFGTLSRDAAPAERRRLAALEQYCLPQAGPFALRCELFVGGGSGRADNYPGPAFILRLGANGEPLAEAVLGHDSIVDIHAIDGSRLAVLVDSSIPQDPARFARLPVLDAGSLQPVDLLPTSADAGSRLAHFAPDGALIQMDTNGPGWRHYAPDFSGPLSLRRRIDLDAASGVGAEGFAIAEAAPDSYFIAGNITENRDGRSGWLLRLTNRQVAWQTLIDEDTYYKSDVLRAMAPAADGGVAVAGQFTGEVGGSVSKVLKFAADGQRQWASDSLRRGDRNMEVKDLVALPDGYAVLASTYPRAAFFTIFRGSALFRLDPQGRLLWSREYDWIVGDDMIALDADRDGAPDDGFAIVGNAFDEDHGFADAFVQLMRLGPDGDIAWDRTYSVREARAHSKPRLGQTTDGGLVVGLSESDVIAPEHIRPPFDRENAPAHIHHLPYGGHNVLVLKTSATGDIQWSRSFGALLEETLHDLRVLPDDGLLVAGGSTSFGALSEAWLLRLDADGKVSDGCNAYLGGLLPSAFDVQGNLVAQITPAVPTSDEVAPLAQRTPSYAATEVNSIEARQCLGSTAPLAPPGPQSILTVSQPGTQIGVVGSIPAGIVCGTLGTAPPCEARFDAGSSVTLVVDPGSVSRFVRWEACDEILPPDSSGASRCTVSLERDREVRAIFGAPRDRFHLRVTVAGLGSVRSSDELGIRCGAGFATQDCDEFYDAIIPGTTLPTSIVLSVNSHQEDFIAWSGDCAGFGIQPSFNLVMDSDKHCTATFVAAGLHHPLTVEITGTGVGNVISDPSGVACPGDCDNLFSPGTTVRLLANEGLDSGFAGWTGCDRVVPSPVPQVPICEVDMNATRQVSAAFDYRVGFEYQLEFVVFGDDGIVESGDHGIICTSAGPDCQEFYPGGISVPISQNLLRAGGTFLGWGGDCAPFNPFPSGTLVMNGDKRCTATFSSPTAPAMHTLSVLKVGPALVASSPAGIDCGGFCSAPFPIGTEVRLSAAPGVGFTISGWSGCDRFATSTGGLPDCIVDMTSDRTVEVRIE